MNSPLILFIPFLALEAAFNGDPIGTILQNLPVAIALIWMHMRSVDAQAKSDERRDKFERELLDVIRDCYGEKSEE